MDRVDTEIEDFRQRFRWKPSYLSGITILTERGPVAGDCKSFGLTVSWILASRSFLRMALDALLLQTVLWACWDRQGKVLHIVTWRRGKGWICNIYPQWGPLRHRLLVPIPVLVTATLASAFEVLCG